MFYDLSGDRITVANEATVLAWNDLLEAVMAHAALAPNHLARALSADPDFALAHATQGLMLLSLAKAELVAPAQTCLDAAGAAILRRAVTRREVGYVDALALWLAHEPRRAAQRLEQILADHPRDALALKLSHGLRFMLGDQREMLVTLEGATPHFEEGHPLAGYVAGCHAFALEELGFYSRAEHSGRRAVALAPRDAWGRHAVAHVLEMTGRVDEGIAWLGESRNWLHANNFRFHMLWHLALFRLERGEVREVLALYDTGIRAERTDDFRDIANGAALLARLSYAGADVGARWEELAELAGRRIADRQLVFADLHYTMALLGAGRAKDAVTIAGNLAKDSYTHPSSERRDAARIGMLAASGLIAFQEGDYPEAAKLLGAARDSLATIGGSNAQRDVFEQAYIESLIRSDSHDRASRVLRERLAQRGGNNLFAARRLARLASTEVGRIAALAVSANTMASTH